MITPKEVGNIDCFSRLRKYHGFASSASDEFHDLEKETFKESPSYVAVYKNFDFETPLDTWIYEGDKDKKDVGIKMLRSYPYDELKFKVGDYIHFDYYRTGELSTWIILSFDSQWDYNWIGTIRECNGELRRIDEFGNVKSFPISFNKESQYTTNYSNPTVTIIAGYSTGYVQFNDDTNKIKANDRFLVGNPENPYCIKVQSNGVYQLRTDYKDPYSAGLVLLKMDANFINVDIDDVPNMIANAYTNLITLVIENYDTEHTVGTSSQITAVVRKNGQPIDVPITWQSSDPTICEVDENGILSFLAIGDCEITASFEENENITDKVLIKVVDTVVDNYEVKMETTYQYDDKLLTSDSANYQVFLYKNDIQQPDTFVFGNSPTNSLYKFEVVDDNSFKITNVGEEIFPVIITAQSGAHIKQFEITMSGAW